VLLVSVSGKLSSLLGKKVSSLKKYRNKIEKSTKDDRNIISDVTNYIFPRS
jgi:hypothetical protein